MAWSEDIKRKVWELATPSKDPKWKKDPCGAWIFWEYFGITSDYGWVIDHIIPISNVGTNKPYILRPVHWENNLSKEDGILVCLVSSGKFLKK